MPTIILATTASIVFGFADFFGGLAAKRDSAFTVTAHSHVVGWLMAAIGLLLVPSTFVPTDLVCGAIVGVAGSAGVVALYAALASGRMGIVAPLTAALSGSLPAVFALVRGAEVGPVQLFGLALAVVAIVIVSASGHPDERAEMPVKAIVLAVVSGTLFAIAVTSLSFVSKDGGMIPLLAARTLSVPMLMGITFARQRSLTLAKRARAHAYAAGALDMAANIFLIYSLRFGSLAVASVLSSLYPVTTILLARGVLGERMRRRQAAGVAIALVAIVLAALK